MFTIGGRAAEIGFGLGGRALAVGDSQLADDALRILISGLELPPEGPTLGDIGESGPKGEAEAFSGRAMLDRSTLCAPSGPAGEIEVRIQSGGGGDRLTCQIGRASPIVLMDLRPRRARFSYSPDGVIWSDRWREDAWPRKSGAARSRALYIRLATDDGSVLVVGEAQSGRPVLHPAPPANRPQGATAPNGEL